MLAANTPGNAAARLGGWCFLRARGALSPRARGQRVTLLLVATLLMALGDLYMTLTFATSVGMIEANPVARLVMSLNSVPAIILWKLSTTLLGLGILFALRQRRLGELGAWAVFLALAGLSAHWLDFGHETASMTEEFHVMAQVGDERFITIDP